MKLDYEKIVWFLSSLHTLQSLFKTRRLMHYFYKEMFRIRLVCIKCILFNVAYVQ